MIEYQTINRENFSDFLFLIRKRGGAEEAFYQWKYFDSPIQIFPWGFLAYHDGFPCGCIGCLSKIFIDDQGDHQPATWFADWYVDPEYRGRQIGLTLQKKVFELSLFAFGITNPVPAQKVAEKAGYRIFPNCIISKGILRLRINQNNGILNKGKQYIKDIINLWSVRPIKGLNVTVAEVNSGVRISEAFSQKIMGIFYKDASYYDWLMKMPGSNRRTWYLCSIESDVTLISMDFASPKEKYMRVYQSSFYSNNNKQFFKYLRILGLVAKYFNADKFESFDQVTNLKWNFRLKTIATLQPMQYNASSQEITLNRLSIADKESSWMQIKM
jgi:hypothetical protein